VIRSSELLGKAVIAASSQHGVLGAESVGLYLESRPGVVVQASDKHGVNGERNAEQAKVFLESLEMLIAVPANEIQDRGSPGDHFLAAAHLAVEHPQRIGVGPSLAVFAEAFLSLSKIFLEFLAKSGAALRASQRIDMEAQAGEPHGLENGHGKEDNLGIRFGTRVAEDLRIDLMELPETALLGAFVPEHRAHHEDLLERVVLVKPVLNVSSHQRGRGFWSEGEIPALAVRERVHLLGDNVGFLADASLEELGHLHEREFDLAESKAPEHPSGSALDSLPDLYLSGKDVFKTFYGRKFQKPCSCYVKCLVSYQNAPWPSTVLAMTRGGSITKTRNWKNTKKVPKAFTPALGLRSGP